MLSKSCFCNPQFMSRLNVDLTAVAWWSINADATTHHFSIAGTFSSTRFLAQYRFQSQWGLPPLRAATSATMNVSDTDQHFGCQWPRHWWWHRSSGYQPSQTIIPYHHLPCEIGSRKARRAPVPNQLTFRACHTSKVPESSKSGV